MAITLEQARSNIGAGVVYRSLGQREGRDPRPPEDGTIVRVGTDMVFVRYGKNLTAATRPEDLDFLVDIMKGGADGR